MGLPVQFNHERSIAAIFSNSVQFIQVNWKQLLQSYLIICPVFILPGVIYGHFHPFVVTHVKLPHQYWDIILKGYTEDGIIRSLLGDITLTAMATTTLTYIKLCYQNGDAPTVKAIWNQFMASFIIYYITFVLIVNVVNLSLLLLVPGIYLIPVAALAISAMMLETLSPREAVSSGFRLIKNNWGVMFGALFCGLLTALAALLVIFRPLSKILLHIQPSIIKDILGLLLAVLCQCLLIPLFVGLAFCYFSLKPSQVVQSV
jgi:hypothetical protein